MQQPENNINNYKGVMLCSRPNENRLSDADRPFCGRVVPHDPLGLTPFSKPHEGAHPLKKKANPILMKHKKWLQQFANKQKLKKQIEELQKWEKEEQFLKLREQAQQNRENSKKMKEQLNTITQGVMNVLDEKEQTKDSPEKEKKKVVALNPENLKKLNEVTAGKEQTKKQVFKKKKQKPAWAYTEQQYKKRQEQEEEELLNFFESTDIDQYVNDIEVSAVLKVLKQKIEGIKKQEDWKEKQMKKIKNKQKEEEDDARSVQGSIKSEGAKSVASQKSSKRIEQLQKQKQAQKEWDANSKASKFSANYDQKIAKNVADEVLRNYGNFKGVHSNTSVRKLLEREALKHLQQEKVQYPTIATVNNASVPLNVSNLPYLHRNPSI